MRTARRLWLQLRMRWALTDMQQREFLFARPEVVMGYALFIADIKRTLEQ